MSFYQQQKDIKDGYINPLNCGVAINPEELANAFRLTDSEKIDRLEDNIKTLTKQNRKIESQIKFLRIALFLSGVGLTLNAINIYLI